MDDGDTERLSSNVVKTFPLTGASVVKSRTTVTPAFREPTERPTCEPTAGT